jgi:NAD(P)-dependent dehydrogenase (short-subunit alcohol dehydrogenase family)
MSKQVWLITGAGRGMGVEFVKAALDAGHTVVASGRDTFRVSKALGQSNDLLPVRLDVTSRADAEAAVEAAVDRFGRIDVLVNNAASFYAGYFEELTPEQFDRQLATSLIGPMNVTRAVLPVMRKQRSGHEFALIARGEHLAGHYVAFVADTAYAPVRAVRICRGADNQHIVVLPNGALHERGELVAGLEMPLVESDVDAIRAQPGRKHLDPGLVRLVIPGVRNKDSWCRA